MKDCVCEKCVNACKKTPGYFAPGEARKAAWLLNMPWEQFRKLLIIGEGYVPQEGSTVECLVPRRINMDQGLEKVNQGEVYDRAPCIFLANERCQIHSEKPRECWAALVCDKTNYEGRGPILKLWVGVDVEDE